MMKRISIIAFVITLIRQATIAQPPPPPEFGPCDYLSFPFGPFADTLALTICANSEVILSADAFTLVNADYYIYEWSNGETTSTIVEYPTETTEYCVFITGIGSIQSTGGYVEEYGTVGIGGIRFMVEALPCTDYYRDFDGDGFGNPDSLVYLPDIPGYGYSLNNLDCNDFDFQLTQPGAICDDYDDCTVGDLVTLDCICAGTFADVDDDGICDANDSVTGTTTSPPGIPYQAEVRNESGEVLANANVNVRFTLHELTANGTVSYQETHALTTNELGLFAATIGAGTIGAGTALQGTFASINWAQTTKFLQVEVDTGSGWITMGNQQLMSVPYALYAANGPAGPAGADGQPGIDGIDGINGRDGVSIHNAYIENGQLFLTLTDNTIISAGSVNNGGGCTNPLACNFNPSFSYDNGSCFYPGYPCDDNNPQTNGEVYNQFCQCSIAVPGCTNSLACNYNPEANQDDGSCITLYGPCSDGNITTVNDYINDECQCVGFTSLSNGTIGNGVTDASGNNYPTVIIGGHEWMAENLRTEKYSNGDLIGYNLTPYDWHYPQWGAWTNTFERSPGEINVHGKLYNRYAATDSRNVCPVNYHIPTATEWYTLLNNISSPNSIFWTAPNLGAPGVSGFSGLLTQYTYGFYQGNECAPGCQGTSYAATENGTFTYFVLGYNMNYINVGAGGPNYGTPIRCVKD